MASLFGMLKNLLMPLLLLLLSGLLGGCTSLSENNTALTFELTNGFTIRSQVAKVPDTVAKRQIIVDQGILDAVLKRDDTPGDGE